MRIQERQESVVFEPRLFPSVLTPSSEIKGTLL